MPRQKESLIETRLRQVENLCVDAEGLLSKLRTEVKTLRLDMQKSHNTKPGTPTLAEAERQAILLAEATCHGHRAEMAKALDIPERTLYRKLREMGISR